VETIRKAATDIADLNEREVDCAQALDGVAVEIEAMVNGARVTVQAQDPDEHTSDACRRVRVLEQLLQNAVNAQRAATPAR
jgi:hypothetical protein